MDNQELICTNCVKRYGDNEGAAKNFRTSRGCEQPVSPAPFVLDDGSLSFSRCVGNYVDKGIIQWIQVADRFAQGTMPFSGGYFDQPSKAIDLFGYILGWRSNQNDRAMKQQQANMEAKRRGR
jgi:hypothetical protein